MLSSEVAAGLWQKTWTYAVLFLLGAILLMTAIGLFFWMLQRLMVRILSSLFGGKAARWLVVVLTFPGTVFHELSHALMAVLTGARVTAIHLLPKGDILGSVEFVLRGPALIQSISGTLTAYAPVLLGIPSLWAMYRFIWPLCGAFWQKTLIIYFAGCLLLHMDLSAQDVKECARGICVCFLFLFVAIVIVNIAMGLYGRSHAA